MTQNQIAFHNAQEIKRHNEAAEAELARHQLREEQLKDRANELQHESNLISKEHYERMDAINATHYANQDQYNLAYLSETSRSNVAREGLTAQQNAINAAAVAETARHQSIMEQIDARLASNTINKTMKDISVASANEAYIQSQTKLMQQKQKEAAANTQLLNAQYLYQLGPRTQETQSSTLLNTQRATTENSARWLNWSSVFRNISAGFRDWSNMRQNFVKEVQSGLAPFIK